MKGGTPSWNTGPIGDHTTGNGYYIYIESSYPRVPGDTAIIESPWMKVVNNVVSTRGKRGGSPGGREVEVQGLLRLRVSGSQIILD